MIMNLYKNMVSKSGLIAVLLVLLVLQSGCAQASSENVARNSTNNDIQRTQWGRLKFQDVERSYLLYTPSSYNSQKPSPLVVVLHGGHGDAEKTADNTGFESLRL